MKEKKTATVSTETGSIALVIQSVRREGDKLVVDGKALGTMRMDMILTPEEFFNAVKIAFNWGLLSFLLLLPYFSLKRLFGRQGRNNNAEEKGQ